MGAAIIKTIEAMTAAALFLMAVHGLPVWAENVAFFAAYGLAGLYFIGALVMLTTEKRPAPSTRAQRYLRRSIVFTLVIGMAAAGMFMAATVAAISLFIIASVADGRATGETA
ncbi:hypothetical protein [Azospirillum brasilense]|uniref:hypothetical protein n=1 Tax=Azospirillum brasilense TaxID=192 RepID=UPI001EDC12B6|nr:hypothetical protein [Azospirillum brasilense]UKJ74562.1 hypothetical protein H1Q64_18560 [Azospirillum brasilense]